MGKHIVYQMGWKQVQGLPTFLSLEFPPSRSPPLAPPSSNHSSPPSQSLGLASSVRGPAQLLFSFPVPSPEMWFSSPLTACYIVTALLLREFTMLPSSCAFVVGEDAHLRFPTGIFHHTPETHLFFFTHLTVIPAPPRVCICQWIWSSSVIS